MALTSFSGYAHLDYVIFILVLLLVLSRWRSLMIMCHQSVLCSSPPTTRSMIATVLRCVPCPLHVLQESECW